MVAFSMFMVLEDAGGARLKVWMRKSLRNLRIDVETPEFEIKCLNAKRVALVMLRRYPARFVVAEEGKAVHLLVAVKVNASAYRALKALSGVEHMTRRGAAKLMEKPVPRIILRNFSFISSP
jgi:hypothetical protein